MTTDHRAVLAGIKTFPQLLAYLRDEMGWPIDRIEIDELMFDYTAEELGIDAKNAPKIEEIKRLRPLSANQPWGIFFIKFAPKRLPVVALRRILGQVVLNKRAKKSGDRAWSAGDLLFISNFGEGESRQISFAHFSQNEDKKDLPTLKVLGWDNLDTPLHLDAVAKELTEHLSWPEDDEDVEAWREQWRIAFTLGHREVITTSKQLSIALAKLARAIRDRIRTALAIETEKGPLTKLMNAFRESLLHDLKPDDFADMYAQTIAYGLLSARIADPTSKTADDFARNMRTNPFLKELMETFLHVGGRRGKAGEPAIDFDELGVNDVVELLDNPKTNMTAVVGDFGDRNPQEDPVIHFYELFLKEYDAKKRMKRGVFYTPRPIVSYIVRSVDELLRTEFGLEDGLADTTTWGEMAKRHKEVKIPEGTPPDQSFVQILDPACGTGTFLVEVIDVIHKTMTRKWEAQRSSPKDVAEQWDHYVADFLLPRLHGYELLMAPYAIAHLKIGLKLHETGYHFDSDERARIFLTNALEPPGDVQFRLSAMPALAHEAQAVNEIKRGQRFTVVIGNPPYSGVSANMSADANELIEPYKYIAGIHFAERKHWLHDDYVKFLRAAQMRVDAAGFGVVGLITNHAFYDNPTFRGMRWNLLQSFNQIRILDLHGNTMKREKTPDSRQDKNVFDIQQGVGISLLTKVMNGADKFVRHGDLWGSRETKYAALAKAHAGALSETILTPSERFYFLIPRIEDNAAEYESSLRLDEIFAIFAGGFITARDHFVIDFDRHELLTRIEAFAQPQPTDAQIRERYFSGYGSDKYPDGDTRGWKVPIARKRVREDVDWKTHVKRCLYRPFDSRWIYWTDWMIDWPRPEVNGHLLNEGNLALIFMRQVASGDGYSHFGVSRLPVDNRACYSNKGIMTLAPLYLHNVTVRKGVTSTTGNSSPRPNFTDAFVKELRNKVGPSATTLTPEDVLHYSYAVFHSPRYRTRYAEFLRIEFPRLPLTANLELFRGLTHLGAELISLHLLESPKVANVVVDLVGVRCPVVEKVSWSMNAVWVDRSQTTGFHGVPEDVWNFHIGGYQVCEKWLKDRRGRTLSDDDIAHYQKIVVAISETIRLMKEIDEVIEQHGGWPGAFQTASARVTVAETPAPRLPIVEDPSEEERYRTCVPLVPLKAAATNLDQEPQFVVDNEWEWVDVGTTRRLHRGMFVAEVEGRSMEPGIPDGSFCLFDSPVEGSRQGKTVLVKLHRGLDPESGANYTIKRYESEKVPDGESWRHERITLKPNNPDFAPLVFTEAPEEEFAVIAEFIEVISPSDDESQTAVYAKGDKSAQSAFSAERTEARPASRREQRLKATPTGQGSLLDSVASSPVPDVRAQPPEGAPEPPERDELICVIRQLFTTGGPRDRETALQELKEALGYQRLGTRIRETFDNALRTAVRRGIVTNEADTLSLQTRSIEDYDRDFLKEQFLASLEGRTWKEREDAIRDFARWLGFRRTGPNIDEAARSLINGLIRENRLESDASFIRRAG